MGVENATLQSEEAQGEIDPNKAGIRVDLSKTEERRILDGCTTGFSTNRVAIQRDKDVQILGRLNVIKDALRRRIAESGASPIQTEPMTRYGKHVHVVGDDRQVIDLQDGAGHHTSFAVVSGRLLLTRPNIGVKCGL